MPESLTGLMGGPRLVGSPSPIWVLTDGTAGASESGAEEALSWVLDLVVDIPSAKVEPGRRVFELGCPLPDAR